MSWIEPAGSSTQCACTRSPVLILPAIVDINGVQQRGVGAVEFDQGPGERAVQRLAVERLGLPTPGHHGADACHRYDLGQLFIGDRVVLGGRHDDASVGAANADDAAVAECGEEGAERRSD